MENGRSCQQHAWACRCLHPARRPWSRPRRLWRGWARWMSVCARVAGKAACASSQCWRGWGACRRSAPSCALLPPRAPSTTWRAGRAASGVAIWPLALAVDATNVTRRSQFALARPRSPVPLWGDDHGGQVFDATAGGKEFAIKYLATYVNQTRASGAFHSFFWFVGRFGARTGLWRSRQK